MIDFDDWRMAQIFDRGIGVSRGDLIIKNVTYEERGQYKCVGQTKSDSAILSAIVNVFGQWPASLSLTSGHSLSPLSYTRFLGLSIQALLVSLLE